MKLIYSGIVSLDGYINDANGDFDWAMPSAEVHAFENDLARPIGTSLYGRRLYETMVAWETMPLGDSPETDDFARLWRSSDKVIYSSTLAEVSSARTRIERSFDPAAVQRLKDGATTDIAIGGPTLAAHAIRAGLVDEVSMVVYPVIVGGGTRFLPAGVTLPLSLLEERRFDDGAVFLRYAL